MVLQRNKRESERNASTEGGARPEGSVGQQRSEEAARGAGQGGVGADADIGGAERGASATLRGTGKKCVVVLVGAALLIGLQWVSTPDVVVTRQITGPSAP